MLPGDGVALGKQDDEQHEGDLGGRLQHAAQHLPHRHPVAVHAVAQVRQAPQEDAERLKK